MQGASQHRHAPEPLPYARLPEELRAHPWPNVVEYPPEGMADAGVAMLRNVNRSPGFQVEGALILTTVKNVIHVKLGEEEEAEIRACPNAALVIACNANGQLLMHAVIQRNAEESRKLYPNNFPDAPSSIAMPLVDASKDLAQLWGKTTCSWGGT